MDKETREKLEDKFNVSESLEQEKEIKLSEFQEKYEKIIIPTIKDFMKFFTEKGITIIEESEKEYIIQRKKQKFLFNL